MDLDINQWKLNALNKQGDLIVATIAAMNLSPNSRATIDIIDKFLVKSHHDLTRHQIAAGARNALERGLLDKERYDSYFIPAEGAVRKYKPKSKKGIN